MSVAKVIEISSESTEGFEDAIRQGIAKASKTVKNMKSAWVKDQNVAIDNNRVTGYRVNLAITFLIDD